MSPLVRLLTSPLPGLVGVLLAVGLIAAAYWARMFMQVEPKAVPFVTFFPAMAVASLIPGRWPSVIALTLSCAMVWLTVLAPDGSITSLSRSEITGLGVYALTGLAFILCGAAIRNAFSELLLERAEMQARAELRRFLLRSLQQCVGRHLQSISAALLAQRGEGFDPPTAEAAVAAAVERLTALERLYRRLYILDDGITGSMRLFIEDIGRDLLTLLSQSSIRLNVRAQQLTLTQERKTCVGLIVAELVTAAAERPRETPSVLEVSIELAVDNRCRLTFFDAGWTSEVRTEVAKEENRLGLARRLVAQMGGTLDVVQDQGTTVIAQFAR